VRVNIVAPEQAIIATSRATFEGNLAGQAGRFNLPIVAVPWENLDDSWRGEQRAATD